MKLYGKFKRTCILACHLYITEPVDLSEEGVELAADNYLGRLSDNYDGRYDCPLGPDVRRGGAPTGDRPQRAAA